MQEMQVQEILDGLKKQIGELTYQLVYRDAIIKMLDEECKKLSEEIEKLKEEKQVEERE